MVMTTLFVITIPSLAQTSIVGNIQTEIVVPTTIAETELLNFGKIVSKSDGGSVVLSPKNNRVSGGNVTLTNDQYSAAGFVVTGLPNTLISMILPQSVQKIYSNNGSYELAVDQFISNIPTNGQLTNSSGKLEINVGATLNIGNYTSNPSGIYSGTYEIIFPNN
ncbi:MAG: DUF4402 domain-containing protein [Paludibacteraceae bacterium]|nr:DUF4402 domain-containing protein [Paludibacteraceae bacterium]